VLLFIGLELMRFHLHSGGFLRRDRRSNEAALKYLLLGHFRRHLCLRTFAVLRHSRHQPGGDCARGGGASCAESAQPVVVLALLTTMVGLLFKIAAVPSISGRRMHTRRAYSIAVSCRG